MTQRNVLLIMLAIAGASTSACNRTDTARDDIDTDTSAAAIPARPESVTARNEAITHGPPICPRRPGSTLITGNGIGPAQLGLSLDSLAKLCTVRDSALRVDEGQPANGRAISVGEGSAPILIFVDEAKKTIRHAATADPFFRTTSGVGVGSTISDLRQNHKQLCGDLGPTGIEVWATSLRGVVFGTTAYPPTMPKGGSGLKSGASAVPDSAQITTVAVTPTPQKCPG